MTDIRQGTKGLNFVNVLGIHEYLYDSSPLKLNLALIYMIGNLKT
jgi:hypothetical protein